MDTARAETGLRDFGDESEFRPALARLLRALHGEAGLDEGGLAQAESRLLAALKNRLWSESCHRAHPEIDTQALAAPLVIVGGPHSGAARLHRLLACDERLAYLRAWEGFNPAPRMLPAWPPHAPDVEARRREAESLLAARGGQDLPAVDAPAPESLLLDQLFCGLSPLEQHDLGDWWRDFVATDRSNAWRALARQLRLVAWSRGDEPSRPWLLGSPQLPLDLAAVHAAFPDARWVFVQHDPLPAVAATLAGVCRSNAGAGTPDRRASVVANWLDVCETSARRCAEARQSIAPAQQMDLHADEIDRDGIASAARVLTFAGLPPDAAASAAMASHLAQAPQATAPAARLQDFGLDEAALATRFAAFGRR